ncbi:MAG: sigma-70 family RNA polymerase sigma factor, partial [Acidobacteriota bacterium]|nr:sigma-70 family RNA polymerase sigma factor [Acidobacteriota bacterium]
FESFVREEAGTLLGFFRRRGADRSEAEDLTQEVFLRVLRGLPSYRAEGREEAWIFTIARNVMLNHRRQRVGEPDREELRGEEPARPDDPSDRLALDEALSRLSELDRDVFLLREVGGLGHDEIGAICDLSHHATRSRIYRARESLRETLVRRPGAKVTRFRRESNP